MIKFKNVNKFFKDLHVLNDVNLEVKQGEVVVVCGPSGSGKSTLIRTVNQLEQIQGGEIWVDGMNVADPKTDLNKVRAEVGFVFQSFNLYPHLNVLENIVLSPMKVKKLSRTAAEKKAMELLDRVGLAHKKDAMPGQLSGGERQMVAMARALMMKPSVLLLDEPSAGLSPMLQDETFIRVRQVNKAGVSVVIIEQNARRCLQICDRGYVLDQGRNAYSGKGRDLMNDPKVVSLYLGNLEEEVQEEGR